MQKKCNNQIYIYSKDYLTTPLYEIPLSNSINFDYNGISELENEIVTIYMNIIKDDSCSNYDLWGELSFHTPLIDGGYKATKIDVTTLSNEHNNTDSIPVAFNKTTNEMYFSFGDLRIGHDYLYQAAKLMSFRNTPYSTTNNGQDMIKLRQPVVEELIDWLETFKFILSFNE